jgi:hypothetical protein
MCVQIWLDAPQGFEHCLLNLNIACLNCVLILYCHSATITSCISIVCMQIQNSKQREDKYESFR